MKKTIAMLCILTLCMGVFAGCKKSEKNETVQPAETESAAETETAAPVETETAAVTETEAEPSQAADEEYLFADLDLSDPAGIEKAADRILETSELHTGDAINQKAVPEGYNDFGITKTEAQAGIVLGAYTYYVALGNNPDESLDTKVQEINIKLAPYSLAQKLTEDLQPGGEGSGNVIVEMVFEGTAGMSKVPPTLICLSTDSGKSWDYRLTSYLYGEIKCSGSDFAFTSKYLGNTASDAKPVLVVFENMGESTWEKAIGIEPLSCAEYFDADILSIEKGEDSQTKVKVGYRGQFDPQTEGMYFQTMLYRRDGDGEVLSKDEAFLHMAEIWAQQTEGEIFPESSERNLTVEEIEAWKVFSERAVPRAYLEILDRALEEIRARAGEEPNEFEEYNINLLEEAEAEME